MRIDLSGPPSAGKTTQGRLISERLGIPHVSSGAIIRDGARAGDPAAARLLAIVADGSLAPSDEIVGLVLARLRRPDCAGGFILDGFPRRLPEAAALLRSDVGPLDAMVALEVGAGTLVARLAERSRQASFFRADDDPDVFPRRIAIYQEETRPVRDFLRSRGIPVHLVDASRPADEVNRDILAVVLPAGAPEQEEELLPSP